MYWLSQLDRRAACSWAMAALLAVLLMGSVGVVAAEKPWREVKDAHFGEVLYYFYQQKYFSAITRLLSAQTQQRLPRHEQEAKLLKGGLYLSYGIHRRAGQIFHALIDEHTMPHVRDRAWFYLAKISYQRGFVDDAEQALSRIQGALPAELQQERQALTALVLMRQQRYLEAVNALKTIKGDSPWAYYARYNMGVALIAAGEDDEGVRLLERVARMRARGDEMRALKDKASLALGYAFLRVQGPDRAKTYLQDVRLNGPFSNRALLGLGWAQAARANYRQALVPWLELQTRHPIDVAVQESLLAVPFALRKLDANAQSLQRYKSAISIYMAESDRLAGTIDAMRAGRLVVEDLLQDPGDEAGWFWHLKRLSDTPENRYLTTLLASHGFHEALKNYRDLLFLSRNLQTWAESMESFDAILETRRLAYEERLPRVSESYRKLDLATLVRQRDVYAQELQRIERDRDAMALATAKEQAQLARLKRVQTMLRKVPAADDFTDHRRKYELYDGILRWQLRTDYVPRLWQARRALRELDQAIAEARTRQRSLARAQGLARAGFEGYGQRIARTRKHISQLQHEVGRLQHAHASYLQQRVIAELEAQRRRLRGYLAQARLGVARIYDRSLSQAEVSK